MIRSIRIMHCNGPLKGSLRFDSLELDRKKEAIARSTCFLVGDWNGIPWNSVSSYVATKLFNLLVHECHRSTSRIPDRIPLSVDFFLWNKISSSSSWYVPIDRSPKSIGARSQPSPATYLLTLLVISLLSCLITISLTPLTNGFLCRRRLARSLWDGASVLPSRRAVFLLVCWFPWLWWIHLFFGCFYFFGNGAERIVLRSDGGVVRIGRAPEDSEELVALVARHLLALLGRLVEFRHHRIGRQFLGRQPLEQPVALQVRHHPLVQVLHVRDGVHQALFEKEIVFFQRAILPIINVISTNLIFGFESKKESPRVKNGTRGKKVNSKGHKSVKLIHFDSLATN